ncbi:MAG: NAD(P)-dependent oxidoreductase [Armatimonadetes bacterium]|nr:NAD(P)-dependent oxidoreductase [Armatimonadota bacterium]
MQGKRVMVLGAAGKMGKHLVPKLVENGNQVDVLARFSSPDILESFQKLGVGIYKVDLSVEDGLKDVPREYDWVYNMAGVKFGSGANHRYTIELQVMATGRIMEHFAGSGGIMYASSGNVYPDTEDGCTEEDMPQPPSFYGMSRLGAEWITEYFCRRNNTPALIQRIFYAYHEEFGVPTDIARQVRDGEEIDITTSYVNCIWLDDILDLMLASAELCAVPCEILNMTGTSKVSVVEIAEMLGKFMGKTPRFKGTPKGTSLLGKADKMARLLWEPPTSLETGLRRVAESVMAYEHPLDHPTEWEKRDKFGEN